MSVFISNLGSGKGTWGHITRIIGDRNWDKVLIITTEFGQENFKPEKDVEYLITEPLRTSITKMADQIVQTLKDSNIQNDVFISVISGMGKEHMALLSALNKAEIKYKLIALTGDGVTEL